MTPIPPLPDTVIHDRPCAGDADWWRVRALIAAATPITPTGLNWEVRRWDGGRFHREPGDLTPEQAARIHLWETADGVLVGAAHADGEGDVYLQIHPDFRGLEDAMFAWGEATLSIAHDDRLHRIETFVLDYDVQRRRVLELRGYIRQPWGGVVRRMCFGGWRIPDPALDPGYRLVTVRPGHPDDCQRIADLLNAAFNRTFHTMAEYAVFTTRAPGYRADFDLVAEAPDGTYAAFVGVYYDAANQRGIFEPVCTHPDHRRHGLARSLMLEGMRRLRTIGARDALVDTGDAAAANALYDAVGFTEAYHGSGWMKVW